MCRFPAIPILTIVLPSIHISLGYWPPPYQYDTRWFNGMPADHFSFDADDQTFSLRYLVNDTFFNPDYGAIFFYCGNEGDITLFANNTGFLWDIAVTHDSMVIFAEHRYYGHTMPFGDKSFAPENLGKLTSEQALADYAVFLEWLKSGNDGVPKNLKPSTPVIAFGGSYGGMLAAWMRIKYPHIIAGNKVTNVFGRYDHQCTSCIKNSWSTLRKFATTENVRRYLNAIFKFCPDSQVTHVDNATRLVNWLADIYGNLAMINYPYETNFLNPVPAWPVKEACKRIRKCSPESHLDVITSIHDLISVFLNYTGSKSCFTFAEDSAPSLGESGWDYQACTEMIMPMCNQGYTMFEESDWNLTAYSNDCYNKYKARPRPNWAVTEYGGPRLKYASNILFSNGDLDPWSGGGILHNISESVVSILVKDGAHHYDLRGKHPKDTPYVRNARKTEVSYILSWMKEYRNFYREKF
uniref:Lysosomal Pro-X carboxypeptidase n=1 Tax=Romanomermis culicivorax TaxID=13658 RepID=A0A915KE66_ROMCU